MKTREEVLASLVLRKPISKGGFGQIIEPDLIYV